MYIQCKQGFVEADQWDGQRIPIQCHQTAVNRLRARSASRSVVVLRSRVQATLVELLGLLTARVVFEERKPRARKVYESPAGWDYQFRAYVTAEEWGQILTAVALGLDYRNFKSWMTKNKPQDHKLAHDIWHAAHEAASPRYTPPAWQPPRNEPSMARRYGTSDLDRIFGVRR